MTRSEGTPALEAFRRQPWQHQLTFETPLKSLQKFVHALLTAIEPPVAASATIDLVVFEPRALTDLFTKNSISPSYERGVALSASGFSEAEELLQVMLSEWIDFLFLPEPPSFAIYADHDEFTTLYAHQPAVLDRLATALFEQGFKLEANYQRRF